MNFNLTDKYILNAAGNPIPEPDLHKWASWIESSRQQRRVGRTEVCGVTVSTVFLGLDHGFRRDGRAPVLWETMIFTNKSNRSTGRMKRCAGSRKQAEAMHARMVKWVRKQNVKP